MSNLVQGNKALRDKDYQQAIVFYIKALVDNPELAKVVTPNIAMAKQGRNVEREKNKDNQKVAVCGWELSDDTAERVYTLAKLYESFTDVEIIGTLFPEYGGQIWESNRLSSIAVHSFMVDDEGVFLEQALKLVLEHPYDVVHLSQPRITNIFFGLLYKLVWDAKVLVDVIDAGEGVSVDDYLEAEGGLPELKDLNGIDWTRLAFGLVDEFDRVTVSNSILLKQFTNSLELSNKKHYLFLQKVFEHKKQAISKSIVSLLTSYHLLQGLFSLIDNKNLCFHNGIESIKSDNKIIFKHNPLFKLIKTWGDIMIIGSAPTIETHLLKIRKHVGECWALNGSWFWLEENNIKVNKAFITDPRFIKDNYEKIKQATCNIIVTIDTINENDFPKSSKEIYVLKSLGRDGFSKIYGEVYHGTSVFFTALQLAYNLGYKKICSCGVIFPPPFSYIRIDGDTRLPEYVHKYQLNNASLALKELRNSKIDFYALEKESNLNFL